MVIARDHALLVVPACLAGPVGRPGGAGRAGNASWAGGVAGGAGEAVFARPCWLDANGTGSKRSDGKQYTYLHRAQKGKRRRLRHC